MISPSLLEKISRVHDLPVSEETLGAYLDGTLSGEALDEVTALLSADDDVAAFARELFEDNLYGAAQDDERQSFENFSMPPVIDFPEDDIFNIEFDNLNPMNSISIDTNLHGEQGQNLSDPVYILQPDDHSCALRSQQIVLRDFGIDIPFKDIERIALEHGVYSEDGTYMYDVAKVLELAGVGMHQVQGCTMLDLMNELDQGHRVIVGVDANELWYTDPLNQLCNWFNDVTGNQGGNHALIVAGIDVNPNDPNDVKVVLTDPGAGHLRVEYPMEQFMDAWQDTNCFMAATNDPAPFQYDPATGMEVPSNFMVKLLLNDFVIQNSYQLSPDHINIPEGYQATFAEHLDMVGDMDHATFAAHYQDMLDTRLPSALTIQEQMAAIASESIESTDHLSESTHLPTQEDILSSIMSSDDMNEGLPRIVEVALPSDLHSDNQAFNELGDSPGHIMTELELHTTDSGLGFDNPLSLDLGADDIFTSPFNEGFNPDDNFGFEEPADIDSDLMSADDSSIIDW